MIYDNYISIKLEGKKHLKSRKDFAVSFLKKGCFCFVLQMYLCLVFFLAKLFLDRGINLMPPAVEAWSLNHWTTREIPFALFLQLKATSLVAHTVKNLPAMWKTGVRSLGREDLLQKGMATHSSILAWIIPWAEEPGGQGVEKRHDKVTKSFTIFTTG